MLCNKKEMKLAMSTWEYKREIIVMHSISETKIMSRSYTDFWMVSWRVAFVFLASFTDFIKELYVSFCVNSDTVSSITCCTNRLWIGKNMESRMNCTHKEYSFKNKFTCLNKEINFLWWLKCIFLVLCSPRITLFL